MKTGQKSPACLMIQGTGSDSGKSTITAGLCRLFARKGLRVMPFKPQNMSNNAAVTIDGGEIGRAQAFQAFAANIPATKYMNPILLKPEGNINGEGNTSQLIICGERNGKISARDYYKRKPELLKHVLDAFQHISRQADIILVEGAGSPAEVNLRDADIANMGFATAINAPVILVADIDRGGVIASIIGTHHLLTAPEKKLMKAYIINQFRGDESLFTDALDIIGKQTGLPSLGIVPFFGGAKYFADEDSMALNKRYRRGNNTHNAQKTICIIRLNHIANADDFTPLERDSRINILLVAPDEPLPHCDWVILAGSKNTIADLNHLKQVGMIHDIYSHLRRGGKILGICAGLCKCWGQVSATRIRLRAILPRLRGWVYCRILTILGENKVLANSNGQAVIAGKHYAISGYEIHLGETHYIGKGASAENQWLTSDNQHLVSAQAEGDYREAGFRLLFSWLVQ